MILKVKKIIPLILGSVFVNAYSAGIQYLHYHPDVVPNIVTSAGIASEIIFEEDEEITYYTFGFDSAWDSAIAQKHILIFKSKDEKPQTNLLVHTSKRHYVFTITVGNDEWEKHPDKSEANYSVRIRYSDNKSIKALKQQEQKAKDRERREKEAEKSLDLRHRSISSDSSYIYCDYSYRATENASPIIPNRMWDDGKITFIRFAPAQKRGVIYELLPNGKTALVNQHTERNGLVVIHGVYDSLIIRLGDEAVETRRNIKGGLMENLTKTNVPNTFRTVNDRSGPAHFRLNNDDVYIETIDRTQIFQEEDVPVNPTHGASSSIQIKRGNTANTPNGY